MAAYFHGRQFDTFEFHALEKGEYEACRFTNGSGHKADLSEFKFIDCEFVVCDLSLAKLNRTAFREVQFRECKLSGLHFESCHDFGLAFGFELCRIDFCTFIGMKLKGTRFVRSQLLESDFTDCDLTGALFDQTDLSRAVFDNTILEKADFRTAYGYQIDPEQNRIRYAKFSALGLVGLLSKYGLEIE